MSTSDKLNRILQSKSDIKDAIIEKGGVVNDSTPLKDYAQAIKDLPSGGGLDLRHVSKITGLTDNVSVRKLGQELTSE